MDFYPAITRCGDCECELKVQKTRFRIVDTLHVGQFHARETVMVCKKCSRTYRSEELCALVAPGSNFGYDVMVYAGKALFLRHRNEEEVVTELAERNVQISPREVSLLGTKFVTYLAMAHQRRSPDIAADMQGRGGYICHLDSTCEGGNPLLMSSIDSLSDIVLGNVKIPTESEANIVPFLERIKTSYGTPLALVHDMGKGILAAVAKVFPCVPDFICHFHFLRDIGKDYLGSEYDIIRKRLKHHGISAKLLYRAKQLKADIDGNPQVIETLDESLEKEELPSEAFESTPPVTAYALIQWTLQGKTEGHGYGFPFDCPHMAFAKRIRTLGEDVESIQNLHLRARWQDNRPYFKIHNALKPIMKDQVLWDAVTTLEEKIIPFEKLRSAMRIASTTGRNGLNDEGKKENIRTIEARVKKFRKWMIRRKNHDEDTAGGKMIAQIDKYWEKLFADPIRTQTATGPVLIQPQRTNNILEQFFRRIKRSHRRRTGNASSRRMLRTILAETPLVKNIENAAYMKILLHGKTSLEAVFAEIEIDTFREVFQKAKNAPEKIPATIQQLIAKNDFPEKLVTLIKKAAT